MLPYNDSELCYPILPEEYGTEYLKIKELMLEILDTRLQNQLDSGEIQLIYLYSSGKFTLKQLGDLLHCSAKTALNRYNTAVAKLQKQTSAEGKPIRAEAI